MQTLKITARLSSAIATTDGIITLDGILAQSLVQQIEAAPGMLPDTQLFPILIRCSTDDGEDQVLDYVQQVLAALVAAKTRLSERIAALNEAAAQQTKTTARRSILAQRAEIEAQLDALSRSDLGAIRSMAGLRMPFRRLGDGEMWYWACSIAQTKWVASNTTHWTRAFRGYSWIMDGPDADKEVDRGSGPMRSYYQPLRLLIPENYTLTWYAVGDADCIHALLSDVASIGKKRHSGHGAVAEWKVEQIEQDWSVCGERGQLMRPIPAEADGPDVGFYAIRPPGHARINQALCRMPVNG